jgi:uncharacterized protein (DUF433 family)
MAGGYPPTQETRRENAEEMGHDLTIMRDPARCAGHPTVGPTRITVHSIVTAARRFNGDIAAMRQWEYAHLSEAQIAAALAYYQEHAGEIDQIIAEQQAAYEAGLRAQQATEGSGTQEGVCSGDS